MNKNYFRIAIRSLSHNKSYATINIIGLAVGIAACMLIFLLIKYETSFDNFHKDKDQIYRVVAANKTPDGINYSRGSAFPVAEGLRMDYPQLKQVAHIFMEEGRQISIRGNKADAPQEQFKEDVFVADPQFFKIFNFPLLVGNPNTALSEPNTVVLTQKIAEKYFGDWHTAMNKFIKYNNKTVCKVTGILKNIPVNTDFPLKVVLSFKTEAAYDTSSSWAGQYGHLNTFVVLPKNMSAGEFDSDLKEFAKKHMPIAYSNNGFILQPLSDIHYNAKFGTYNKSTFSKELITALSLIGIFLLIIACINFINLSTAQAVNRSKEVGIRKVLGSSKKQLIIQFLSETFVITLASIIVAIAVSLLVLPLLNNLLNTHLKISFDAWTILFLLMTVIVVTFLSGFYPAIILSGFNPITALKSKFTGRPESGFSLRKVLVVLQFTIAQALIIGTLIILSQMNFFKNAPLGFDKDAIVTVPIPNDSVSQSKISALKEQLLQQAGIKDVSFSTYSPMDNSSWDNDFRFDNSSENSNFSADLKWADADYFKAYNIQFVAGGPYQPSDTVSGFVLNELMVKKLGFQNPQDILGKKINFWDGQVVAPVVGVIKNFHGHSLEQEIKPTALGSLKSAYQLINIKIQTQNAKPALAAIEKKWKDTYPNYTYEYQFLDDKIASFYKQESQLSQLYKIFAAIAIFISCLGLYGFVSFMAVRRTKEVGIRKALGASVLNIIYLFSNEFTVLISISFLIATPLTYYFMHHWLQDFAYRINIGTRIFILTFLLSIMIAWLTVGYRAIKAAIANPVKSLRIE